MHIDVIICIIEKITRSLRGIDIGFDFEVEEKACIGQKER
jgi:hypothetical protein